MYFYETYKKILINDKLLNKNLQHPCQFRIFVCKLYLIAIMFNC